jgi:hypothetical protein
MSAPRLLSPTTTSGGTPVGGSGTGGTIPRWTGTGASSTLTDSIITQNTGATAVAIGSSTFATNARLSLGGASSSLVKLSYMNNADEIGFDSMSGSNGERRFQAGPPYAWGAFVTWYTDATEKMRLVNQGNLGIGTPSPTDSGNWSAGRVLDVRSGSAGVSSVAYFGDSTRSTNMQIGFYGSGYGFVGTVTNHALSLRTGNVERAQIDTSGNVILNSANTNATIQATGTGQGLKLPTTPGNTDPNTLDCYAEATWAPTISSETNCSGTTITNGRSTRIGRLVIVEGYATINVTAATTATSVYITIPFNRVSASVSGCGSAVASASGFVGSVFNGGATLNTVGIVFQSTNPFGAGSTQFIPFSYTYFTAT